MDTLAEEDGTDSIMIKGSWPTSKGLGLSSSKFQEVPTDAQVAVREDAAEVTRREPGNLTPLR